MLKKKRLILMAVLLVAVVAVLVPFRQHLWIAITYDSVVTDEGFAYKRKRWDWVDGNLFITRNQTCPQCTDSDHFECFNSQTRFPENWKNMANYAWFLDRYAGGVLPPGYDQPIDWRCICLDPTHAGNK